jgi:hypothetical protein
MAESVWFHFNLKKFRSDPLTAMGVSSIGADPKSPSASRAKLIISSCDFIMFYQNLYNSFFATDKNLMDADTDLFSSVFIRLYLWFHNRFFMCF